MEGLFIALMMEVLRTSETLVNFSETLRRYTSENSIHQTCEYFNTYIGIISMICEKYFTEGNSKHQQSGHITEYVSTEHTHMLPEHMSMFCSL
jgi:hypothetical protein